MEPTCRGRSIFILAEDFFVKRSKVLFSLVLDQDEKFDSYQKTLSHFQKPYNYFIRPLLFSNALSPFLTLTLSFSHAQAQTHTLSLSLTLFIVANKSTQALSLILRCFSSLFLLPDSLSLTPSLSKFFSLLSDFFFSLSLSHTHTHTQSLSVTQSRTLS